jgi:TonB family protein
MRINWKIGMSVAAVMTVFYVSMVGGKQQETPMDETIKVVTAVAPVFPPIVVASNTSGNAVIEVQIDTAGHVISTRVVDGHPLLRKIKSIQDTALRWRFIPTAENTPRTVRLTFAFEITPKGTPANELTPVFIPPYKVEVRHMPLEPIVHTDPPTYVRPAPRVKRP